MLRLWEGARGDLAGFTWHAPPGPLILQSDPGLPAGDNPEPAMLAWAEERQQAAPPDQPPAPLVTSALGATTAVVCTPASNEPALRLYHAVGFAIEQHEGDYQWHG